MAVLNLNRSLIFYFKSFFHYFFVARKSNQKAPVTGKDVIKRVKRQACLSVLKRVITSYLKSVITAFCSRVASDIPRPAERWSALLWGAKAPVVANIAHSQWYHKQLFVQASGTKQLAFHAITATQQCTAQTYFVLFPLLTRLFAEILMVTVFFEITIVHGKAQRYKVHKKILAAYVIGGQYPFID